VVEFFETLAMISFRFSHPARCWLALLAFSLAASSLCAAEPVIRNLDVRGLRVGGTTTLAIDGDDLGKAPRLLLPFAANQTLKPGGTDKRAVFDVTLADDVTPGYHHLRIVTDGGVSAPVVICTDRLPQEALAAAVKEVPVALHGAVAGGATVATTFQGRAKQRVMIEVEAQRLGSKLKPVLHLYNSKKLQIAWAWGGPALHGDARLEAVLPEDGAYTVTLHDVEYAAVAPGFFRLRIGDWAFVDQVFPPVLARDQAAAVELLGMAAPRRLDVAPAHSADAVPLAWPRDGAWSGPRPFVTYSTHPEFVQQANKGELQQLPQGPVGVSGRLLTPNAEDRYRVAVAPGTKLRIEVFAERIGSPIDAALVVRNDKGDALARAEDAPGTLDPVLEYTVPDKVTSIVVGVVDAQGRGGPRGVYRLVIEPQTPAAGKGGFQLSTLAQRASLPAGGRVVVPILVERQGYQGKIDLTANLPPGVKLDGAVIPEGADGTLVTLQRDEAPFDAIIAQWRGRGSDGAEQAVVLKGHPLQKLQPWMATEFALAPSDAKTTDLFVDWRNLPDDAGLVPGRKFTLPIKAARANEKTTVKLTLLTSQVTPILNNQPDPNRALRQEKAVEMPVKATDGEVVVLVPGDLSAPVYAVTVQAELLAADKKVLATAYAPVRHMVVRQQVIVKLDGPNRIEAKLDPKKGAVAKIRGKIERHEGMKGDVALALTGLPAGLKAGPITVKGDATDFTLDVVLPPTVTAGEIRGLKLTGSFAPDAKQPNQRVRSRDVELTLVLQ
jgi:hypothetical protein